MDRVKVSSGVPAGMVHVTVPYVGQTCRRLKIWYAKAIVGSNSFVQNRVRRHVFVYKGIVIKTEDHQKLLAAFEEKAKKEKKLSQKVSVLDALFTLNRRAKRCRDLSQTYYQQRMHGLAGKMKEEKEHIYGLKGQVLEHLLLAKRLTGGKYTVFSGGNWAEILEGEGYRFHRPCPPQETTEETVIQDNIEAKPKGSKEPTIKLALEIVESFLEGKETLFVYEWARKSYTSYRDEDDDFDDDEGVDYYVDDDDY